MKMNRNIKLTSSIACHIENNPASPTNKKSLEVPNVSACTIVKSQQSRQRLPPSMHTILKKMSSSQKINHESGEIPLRNSTLGQKMRTGFIGVARSFTNISFCLICDAQMVSRDKHRSKDVYMCDCEHKYSFCESCLHHYVIFKVSNFQQVNCPQEGCPATLDMESPFFKNLPADIQKNYKKISQFHKVAKDPDTKLCPSQNCQGIIRKDSEDVMECDTCHKKYCSMCLLAVHSGPCDSQQMLFFQQNLHYRKCKKCGIIIQKDQGCNHMVCKCKYQFCYVCGQPWSAAHYVDHGQDGQIIEGMCAQACDGCQCNCRCNLHYQYFDSCYCNILLKAFMKVTILMLFLPLMLLLFIVRDIPIILLILVVTIVTGLFAFSVELIINFQLPWRILCILLFPVTMLIGVVVAFREVFAPLVGRLCSNYGEMVNDGVQSICDL